MSYSKFEIVQKIVQMACLVAAVLLLVYGLFVLKPREDELFRKCESKMLCEAGLAYGKVCEQYNFTIIPPDLSNITAVGTIPAK